MEAEVANSQLSDDLMIGIKPIANWLNQPVRKIFYMAEKHQLPLFKIGGKWAGRKSTILQHIALLEAEQAA